MKALLKADADNNVSGMNRWLHVYQQATIIMEIDKHDGNEMEGHSSTNGSH
jgi:hypothetical protein